MHRRTCLRFYIWLLTLISNTQTSFKCGICRGFFLLFNSYYYKTRLHFTLQSLERGCLVNNSLFSSTNNYAYILDFYLALFRFFPKSCNCSLHKFQGFALDGNVSCDCAHWGNSQHPSMPKKKKKRWSVILEHSYIVAV